MINYNLASQPGVSFLRQLNMESIVSCRLNPLKVHINTSVLCLSGSAAGRTRSWHCIPLYRYVYHQLWRCLQSWPVVTSCSFVTPSLNRTRDLFSQLLPLGQELFPQPQQHRKPTLLTASFRLILMPSRGGIDWSHCLIRLCLVCVLVLQIISVCSRSLHRLGGGGRGRPWTGLTDVRSPTTLSLAIVISCHVGWRWAQFSGIIFTKH